MIILKGANLLLRFLLELCLLAALGYWGFHTGAGAAQRAILGVGVPVVMAIVWGLVMSPKAKVRLPRPLHLVAEVAIFGLGAWALFATGQPVLAWIFAALAVLNRTMIAIWRQESLSHGRAEPAAGP